MIDLESNKERSLLGSFPNEKPLQINFKENFSNNRENSWDGLPRQNSEEWEDANLTNGQVPELGIDQNVSDYSIEAVEL